MCSGMDGYLGMWGYFLCRHAWVIKLSNHISTAAGMADRNHMYIGIKHYCFLFVVVTNPISFVTNSDGSNIRAQNIKWKKSTNH